jgi:hypothetical protein
MPQPNDLSRSLVALDQNSTIIAVIEMSQSSWLVAGMLPGCKSAPKWDPTRTLEQAFDYRRYLPGGWGPDRRRLGPHQTAFSCYASVTYGEPAWGPGPMLIHTGWGKRHW